MKSRRIIAAGLAAAMLFTSTAFASDMYATRGEVADMLLNAADDYNKDVKRSDIIQGYEGGELHEDWNITRAEALVMLKRAFGALPALTGHNERVSLKNGSFTDIPDWAKDEIAPVLDAGIAAGTADGIFSPYDDVTKEQMDLFIKRAYAIFGTNEKDDFYAAVDKDLLNTLEIKPGRVIAGSLFDLQDKVDNEINEIIKEIINNPYEKGSKEQKIADFYKNLTDTENRNKAGVAPIKKYIEMINNADSIEELAKVQTALQDEICYAPFTAFSINVDFKDSTKYIPVFGTYEPVMPKDFYAGGAEQKAPYLKYIKKLFELSGEEMTDEELNKFCDFEGKLSESKMNIEDMGNVDKIYNILSPEEIQKMFPSFDIDEVLDASGIKSEEKILIADLGATKQFASLFTNENLGVLKTAAKLGLLMNYGGALNTDFAAAADEFNGEYLGISGSYSEEERAVISVSTIMSDYLGDVYGKKFFSEEARENVTKMIEDIISVYKERIDKLDWMSAETKKRAKNKLDKMGVKVGYPEGEGSYLDDVDIKSFADGGSCFDNIVEISKAMKDNMTECQGTEVDKTAWDMTPYSVNACYSATSNDITFPAAILQAPMYDVNASYEENLGAIGYIIAHEITHAFDNNGAKFDENGNAADWWTAEDYAAFEKLCDKVRYFYDRCESIPGVPTDGSLTLSENVSDLGAVQCITEVVSRVENPDYEKLYRSMARAWASTRTREYAQYAAVTDVHSDEKLRVNRTVVNCDEFYETFGITEKDGMWVAPQERIRIW